MSAVPLDTVPMPALAGPRTVLRQIEPGDYPFLRSLASLPENLVCWRERGVTRRPEEFVDQLWGGTIAQFVVARKAGGQPIGLVSAFGADMRNRHAHLGVLFDPNAQRGSGWRMESVALFLGYLFDVFEFHKLYAEVLDFNLGRFASGLGRYFTEEGCLVDHEYLYGRRWDLHVLAIHRDQFDRYRPRLARILAPVPTGARVAAAVPTPP
jgi:RimJ/RimL family protein N-acetyltransferase